MSIPREDSNGAVPSATAPEPLGGASPEEMEVREDLTIEAKDIREAIRFGHADAKERFREFDERCETAGWGRSIADRLFRALHREDLPRGPATFLMSLTATVRAFREPTNWRGPARRALERLGSLPESVGILPNLEAERDARGRLEEAEQARRDAWGKLEEAEARTSDMLAMVASIRETWNTRPLSLGEALDASPIPGEAKLPVLDAWRSWEKARSVESDGNAALGTLERELAALPVSPERTAFDETGIELHPVDGVPGIFDVAAALNARGDRMREFADWENDEPKLEDVPVPNTARPSIPEDVNLKRHATENVLSAASRPVAFLFRNAKYWAIVGGVLFLAFWWIPPLGRWAYGEDESFWRAAFWMFLEFFGPLLAFVWRWHREEIERMRLYSEWADKTVGDRLSELERTHSASGDLTELLAELSKKRSWAKSVTKDSIRIIKETQGFRTLPDWLSDAEERFKNIKARFFKTWEDVLDAVAAAATLEDRKSELARRTAVWRERGEALAARRRETLELLRTAVESTSGQIAAKRETLETATKSAAATVAAALSEILSRAEIPAPSTEAARAANEAAARQADAARRAWEAAKAATDATVAKEEEREKRRAEARIEFARLKDRTVRSIRSRLGAVRASPDSTDDLVTRTNALEEELAEWERGRDLAAGGLAAETERVNEWEARIGRIEDDANGLRHRRADQFLQEAKTAFTTKRFEDCIAKADECLRHEPDRADAVGVRQDAQNEIERLEREIQEWKDNVEERRRNLPRVSWFESVASAADSCADRLQGYSSWTDHRNAREAFRTFERKAEILGRLEKPQFSNERDQQWRIVQDGKRRIDQLKRRIPEALHPQSDGSFDEMWRNADAAACRGSLDEALAGYGKVVKQTRSCLNKWNNAVRNAFRAMAKEASDPVLSNWIAQNAVDNAERNFLAIPAFVWNWMPNGRQRHRLPDPTAVLFSMSDPEAAGRWIADLYRFAKDAGKEIAVRYDNDAAAEQHKTQLRADANRLLERMCDRQDDLLVRMRDCIDWFSRTEQARNQAHSLQEEAKCFVDRASALRQRGLSNDTQFAEQLGQTLERGSSEMANGNYDSAVNSFQSILAASAELNAREARADAQSSIAELESLYGAPDGQLRNRLDVLDRDIDRRAWEAVRNNAHQLKEDAGRSIEDILQERERIWLPQLAEWLARHSRVSEASRDEFQQRLGPICKELRGRSVAVDRLEPNHVLVRLLEENGRVSIQRLAETMQIPWLFNGSNLGDVFRNLGKNIGRLRWALGRRCDGELQAFFYRRSAEAGDNMGIQAWNAMH